jgi:hypothetical protein
MKKGDLVRFNKIVVSELLDDNVDNWENWIGIVLYMQDEDFCKVSWQDGVERQEFVDQLEVINESR